MSKKVIVQGVGSLSLGRLIGTVNGLIAAVVGLIAAVVLSARYIAEANVNVFEGIVVTIGIVAAGVLLYPLVMFAVGWLYGVLIGIVFNAFVGLSGGLELTTEDVK
jgi:hypothetical protein